MEGSTAAASAPAQEENVGAAAPSVYDVYSNNNDVDRFEAMELGKDVISGIYHKGFERPSPIQMRGILPLVRRQDVIAKAQSGTGKTATFCIAALQILDISLLAVQVLVMCPTRELASQVQAVCQDLGHKKKAVVRCVVGGTAYRADANDLRNGCHIIIGCPGRLNHLYSQEEFTLDHLKLLVLDEADELMAEGFRGQMGEFLEKRPADCTIAFFSATYSVETKNYIKDVAPNCVEIEADASMKTLDGLDQFYILVEQPDWKKYVIDDLYASMNISQTIIYVNRKDTLRELYAYLQGQGHAISFICADMPHDARADIMYHFRNGSIRILLSTDLLARGIDVQQVSLVMNFDMPTQIETYIHRIGRSGRYGRKGVAINIVTQAEVPVIQELEQHYQCQIPNLPENFQEIMADVAESHKAEK